MAGHEPGTLLRCLCPPCRRIRVTKRAAHDAIVKAKGGAGRPPGPAACDLTLTPADLTPCAQCGLRGHTAGDPDRCLNRPGSGLGQSPWMQELGYDV